MEIVRESAALILEMKSNLQKFEQDPLTTDSGYHITGTLEQACNDLWHFMRVHRITASKFLEWVKSALNAIHRYYNEADDISNLPWIKWGTENESVCIEQYNNLYPDKITRCGCFVSKKEVNISASPDGLILSKQIVVEVKCPWNRKTNDPNVFIPDFCYYDDFGKIQLKRTHVYFWQIQCQMYCTGFKKGKFLV